MKTTRGLWIWRLDRAGGAHAAVRAAQRWGFSRLIVKSRDGLTPHNRPGLDELANAVRDAAGVELWVWAWCYARNAAGGNHDVGGRAYVQEQARRLAEDAARYGARGVAANIEAPFSAALTHRWGPGHQLAWGGIAKRRAELALRADLYGRTLADASPASVLRRGLSTFPRPQNHALPFRALVDSGGFNLVMPMLYFSQRGGFDATMARSTEQWRGVTDLPLRYSGPAFRGAANARAVDAAADHRGLCTDWWCLDRSDPEALAALAATPAPVAALAA